MNNLPILYLVYNIAHIHQARIVRGHDDGHALLIGQLLEYLHHLETGIGIQFAGRFIGEYDLRSVCDGPGDGHALLFTAGEFTAAVVDSIREVDSAGSHAVDRSRLRAVQTPQIFRSDLLRKAYEAVGARLDDRSKATDDASVVEMYGEKVALYEGEPNNLKLTTPTDLSIAEVLLQKR